MAFHSFYDIVKERDRQTDREVGVKVCLPSTIYPSHRKTQGVVEMVSSWVFGSRMETYTPGMSVRCICIHGDYGKYGVEQVS